METACASRRRWKAIGTLAGESRTTSTTAHVINGYGSILSDALPDEQNSAAMWIKSRKRLSALWRSRDSSSLSSRKQTIQPGQLKLNHVIAGMEKLCAA